MKFKKIRLTQKQLDKIADQARLLSWAQSAIFTQLHVESIYAKIALTVIFWCALQSFALFIERNQS